MDVERQHADLRVGQPFVPRRHMTLPATVNGCDDSVQVAAVEPVVVCQVGCASLGTALAGFAMAGGTGFGKNLLTRLDALDVLRRREFGMGERIDIGR